MPDKRYRLLRGTLRNRGSRALDTMFNSCTTQVSVLNDGVQNSRARLYEEDRSMKCSSAHVQWWPETV